MQYTYIIRSTKDNSWYTGTTADLRKRFALHNTGHVRSTAKRAPFELTYYEACRNQEDAFARERYLKSGPGKRFLRTRLKRFLALTGSIILFACVSFQSAEAGVIINAPKQFGLNYGLVGCWTFDGSYTKAPDCSGNNNTGTLTNGPTKVAGKIGQALSFDKVNDVVTAGSATLLDDVRPISISLWIKPNSAGENNAGFIIEKTNGVGVNGWVFEIDNTAPEVNTFQFTMGGATDLIRTSANDTVSYGVWQHVVLTWDGSVTATNVHIYKNGVAVSYTGGQQQDGATLSSDAAEDLAIGNFSNSFDQTVDGLIDDVRIYNRALSAAEIRRLYLIGEGSKVNRSPTGDSLNRGLVGCWTFDGSYTKAPDCSGNGNTGTLTGGPTKVAGKVGQALSFDGVDDYVDAGAGSSIDLGDNFTISGWIYLRSAGSYPAIVTRTSAFDEATAKYAFYLQSNTRTLSFAMGGSTNNAFNLAVPLNQWAFVAISHARFGGGTTFYMNMLTQSHASFTPPTYSGEVLKLGTWTSGNGEFPGLIDDVRVYNRALSAAEIKRLHLIGLGSTVNRTVENLGFGKYTGMSFDTAASGNTQPFGITSFDGYFWVTDIGTDEVYKYTADGTYTGVSFDTFGSGGDLPVGITAYNGFFWVTDTGTDEVYKYNLNGSYTGTSFDTAVNGNTTPTGIIGYNNFFWITDSGTDEVYKYNIDGTYTGTSFDTAINGNSNPTDITSYNGFFWIVDQNTDKVYKYKMDGSYAGFSFDTSGSGNGGPNGITVYNNFFWIADNADSKVYKYRGISRSLINTTQTTASLASGLVGHWTFDGPDIGLSGTRAKDRSGAGNHGTITGAALTAGKVGQGMNFDGVNDNVVVTDNDSLSFTDGAGSDRPLSISVWMKPSERGSGPIVAKLTNELAGEWNVGFTGVNGTLQCLVFNSDGSAFIGRRTPSNAVGIDTWSHVVWTYDGSEAPNGVKIYVDGQRVDSSDVTSGTYTGMTNTSINVTFNSYADNVNYRRNLLDDVRIYNRVLSAGEIKKLYNQGR